MRIGHVRDIWRFPAKSMQGERLDSISVLPSGLCGDRGWALRDEASKEIASARKLPRLLQLRARYRSAPDGKSVPPIDITLPDGEVVGSGSADVHRRISDALDHPVTLWPLQPATDRAHYRRAQPGAAVIGWLSQSQSFRRLMQRMLPYIGMEKGLRADFGREPDEPLPDLSLLPAELIEFASPPGTYFDAFPVHLLTTASLATMMQATPQASWDVRRFRPNFVIETIAGIDGLPEAGWSGRTVRLGGARIRCEMPTVRCSMTMAAQGDLAKDPAVLRTIVRTGEQNLGAYARVVTSGAVEVGAPVELE